MSRTIHNLEVPVQENLEEILQWKYPGHGPFRILRKSVDARRRHEVRWVYSIEIADPGEVLQSSKYEVPRLNGPFADRPLIIGAGPAGLFAALRLVERGIPCTLLERGSDANQRIKSINQYWRYGKLDPNNNVCFGEGGAGLYSDGKLITRIKSPEIPYVMHRLVQFGAPEEIQYLSNPHVGSDRIRRVIPFLRQYLIENGCEIHFNEEVTDFIVSGSAISGVLTRSGKKFESHHIVLATGHSAGEIFDRLLDNKIQLEGKSFAMGLRVEHPQALINQIQYRQHASNEALGAANYRLTHHDSATGIGVYSFCMCPGGYVLSSGTEADGVVSNGMSNYKRNSPFANAAIVVSIDHDARFGADLLGGMRLRSELEKQAYQRIVAAGGSKELPAQNLSDFLEGKLSPVRVGSSPSGSKPVRLDEILPADLTAKIREGFDSFNKSMKGFINTDAVLYGIESRTSCPIRVTRDDESLMSVSHQGLYPCGEGAGYAGGITSAACDGIRVAEAIAQSLASDVPGLPWHEAGAGAGANPSR